MDLAHFARIRPALKKTRIQLNTDLEFQHFVSLNIPYQPIFLRIRMNNSTLG